MIMLNTASWVVKGWYNSFHNTFLKTKKIILYSLQACLPTILDFYTPAAT